MKHKLTRLTSLLLALVMSFSMLLVPAYASEFADVPANAWYEEAVDYVQENGWMKGVSANSFAPNAEVTRAMFVTVLARYAEANVNDEQTTQFDDVPSGTWYTGAVAWAAEKGIVNGVSANAFAPNRAISRQELCTMLARFINKQGYELNEGEAKSFTDAASIAGFAKDAVVYCARTGLVAGYTDGSFRPTATASRAQTATILMRLDKAVKGENEEPVPMPAQTFHDDADDDMSISVNAPEGALPENSNMTTSRVTDLEALCDIADQVNGCVYAAADITFSKDGTVLEPKVNVEVQISIEGLEDIENPTVVHVKADGTVETVNGVEMVSVNRRGNKVLRFYAKDFSVYAVIGGSEQNPTARITVNFYGVKDTINGTPADPENNTPAVAPKLEYSDTPTVSYEVKNDDVYLEPNASRIETVSYINDIVADPGIGVELTSNTLFRGWSMSVRRNKAGTNYTGANEPTKDNVGKNYTLETTPLSIEGVWKALGDLTKDNWIVEGDVIDVYPIIFKYFTVTYYGDDDDVSLGSHIVYLRVEDNDAPYRVVMDYTPDATQDFKGWKASKNDKNVETYPNISGITKWGNEEEDAPTSITADTCFPNNTEITIQGDIVFKVYAPTGVWLVYNTNGKGGTYNAPQFYLKGTLTTPAANATSDKMLRRGYHFVKWCCGVKNNDVWEPDTNTTFEFGQPINADTQIFAVWEENTTAEYVVLFWEQNVNGWKTNAAGKYVDSDGNETTDPSKYVPIYDFISASKKTVNNEEVMLTGTVGHKIVVDSSTGDTVIKVYNGDTCVEENAFKFSCPKGCYFDRSDMKSGGTSIVNDGSTVINVYYNRRSYTLTFGGTKNTTYSYVDSNGRSSTFNVNNSTTQDLNDYITKILDDGNALGGFRYYSNSYYLVRIDGSWYYISANTYNTLYSNAVSVSVTTTYSGAIKQFSALYGASIGSNFPVDNTGNRWRADRTDLYPQVLVYIDTMPEADVFFTRDTSSPDMRYMEFYVETLPGETGTETWKNKTYVKYGNTINARYNFFTINEDFPDILGLVKEGSNPEFNSNGRADVSAGGTLKLYYSREKYSINYMDGVYVNGNGQRITDETNRGQWKEVTDVLFGADISSYNEGGDNYYTPERGENPSNYIFDGWYIDSSCTTPYTFDTMGAGSITVYAKWQLKQYRVFLHPNAGDKTSVPELSWGDDDKSLLEDTQKMTFRIDSGGRISLPFGTRSKYEFRGWFYENGSLFTESTELNDKTVTTSYDKTTSYTDVIDKWGNLVYRNQTSKLGSIEIPGDDPSNSDLTGNNNGPRYWITKKLDLYGQWRMKMIGSSGVKILYSANDPTGPENNGQPTTIQGHFPAEGEQAVREFEDPKFYLDQTNAISIPACVPDDANKYQFLYWVVQEWNGEAFVDTEIHAYPGDTFTVEAINSKITDGNGTVVAFENLLEDGTKYNYVLRVRAEYGERDAARTTYIDWYANNGTNGVQKSTNVEINENVLIPTQETWKNGEVDPHAAEPDPESGNVLPLTAGETGLTYEGHTFLGWARLQNVNGKLYRDSDVECQNEITSDTSVLTADDLFLRWIPASGEGENAVAAHYEAKNPAGTWVPVENVACDEKHPYNDLYAVWTKTPFFVFHSSSGVLEAIDMPVKFVPGETENDMGHIEEDVYDLTTLVADGYLYGGYYTSFGGVATDEVQKLANTFTMKGVNGWTGASMTGRTQVAKLDTSDIAAVNFKEYTGDSRTFKVNSDTKYYWDKNTAGNTNNPGNAFKPVAGQVYYLKEVPDEFLTTKYVYVYDTLDGNETDGFKVKEFFLFTLVDDNLYSDIGFRMLQDSNSMKDVMASSITSKSGLSKSYTITRNVTDAHQGPAESITIDASVFAAPGGYVASLKQDSLINTSFAIVPTWTTKDGVKVGNEPQKLTVSAVHKPNVVTVTAESLKGYIGTEKLYIDTSAPVINPDDGTVWETKNAITNLYFFGEDGNVWTTTGKIKGNLYVGVIPAGNWDKVIVVRGEPGTLGWSWNQTVNISLEKDKNLIVLKNQKGEYGDDYDHFFADTSSYTPQNP